MHAPPPTAASLDTYPDRPMELVPVDITKNTMTEMENDSPEGQVHGGQTQ